MLENSVLGHTPGRGNSSKLSEEIGKMRSAQVNAFALETSGITKKKSIMPNTKGKKSTSNLFLN
jgi:hypothetical protein